MVDLDRNKITIGLDTPTIPSPPARKWTKLTFTLKRALGDIFDRAHGLDTKSSTTADNTNQQQSKDDVPTTEPPNGLSNNNSHRRDIRRSLVWTEKLQSWDYAFNLAYSPDSELMDDFTGKAMLNANGQTQWETVQEAFLRFFVTLFRNYRKYLNIPQSFENDDDPAAAPSRPSFDVVEFLRVQPQSSLPFMKGKPVRNASAVHSNDLCFGVPF